jgi:hypothetical protein
MLVSRALEVLIEAVKNGHGDLPLVSLCTSSGDSRSVSMYGEPKKAGEQEQCGDVCDMDNDALFIPVYLG